MYPYNAMVQKRSTQTMYPSGLVQDFIPYYDYGLLFNSRGYQISKCYLNWGEGS